MRVKGTVGSWPARQIATKEPKLALELPDQALVPIGELAVVGGEMGWSAA